MNIKLTSPLGLMAVVTDNTQRVAAVLDVDTIHILSAVINPYTGLAQFALAFGGVDPNGNFHLDPNRMNEVAQITISRDQNGGTNRQFFDSTFKDPNGNPKWDYPESFFAALVKDCLIEVAYQLVWGGPHPDMQVQLDGQLIFPKPRPAA